MSSTNIDFLDRIHQGQRETGFDIDTCYAIADLAERLEIPVLVLMHECFNLMTDVHSDPRYISDKEMVAMDIGIHTYDDLDKICEHYSCKYYDLNSWMVNKYYQEKHTSQGECHVHK